MARKKLPPWYSAPAGQQPPEGHSAGAAELGPACQEGELPGGVDTQEAGGLQERRPQHQTQHPAAEENYADV